MNSFDFRIYIELSVAGAVLADGYIWRCLRQQLEMMLLEMDATLYFTVTHTDPTYQGSRES
jgi:hypothetical protein